MKRIAIIGSGISGTSAAYYLNQLGYDVSLFESQGYFGGHTNTQQVTIAGKNYPIDTGFLVHNDRTYPNLIEFFKELEIEVHKSEMSFSVQKLSDNMVWAGTNLTSLFAQKKNLFSFKFYSFIFELLRFNRNAAFYLEQSKRNTDRTLGELLEEHRYSREFRDWYLLPMGGCIWSCPTNEMLQFPAYTFLTFCMNHGLLQIFNRPLWKTVVNGCKTYVEKALVPIEKKYLSEPVRKILPEEHKITIVTDKRSEEFDYCLICSHPPEALKLVVGLDHETHQLLSCFKYQKNKAVLHLDEKVLPGKRSAWAAWNYVSENSSDGKNAVSVSYLINKLQPLPFDNPVIVTLNPVRPVDVRKIVKEINYEHPVFSAEAIRAQETMMDVQGRQRLFFSGAWMRYGFHEDGILSSKKVLNKILEMDGRSAERINIL